MAAAWTGRFRSWSIRAKLIGLFAVPLAVLVLFQVFWVSAQQASEAEQALRIKGRVVTQLVAHDVGAAFEFGEAAAVSDVFKGATSDPDLAFVVLFDKDGKVFAALNPELAPPQVGATTLSEVSDAWDAERLIVRAPVVAPGGARGLLVAGFLRERIIKAGRAQQLTASVMGLIMLIVGLLASAVIGNYVSRRLGRFVAFAERVAEGDLSVSLSEETSADEIGRLSRSLRGMVTNLRRMADNIRETSNQVAASAGQISANARSITQGAQSQAQASEDTSASMEEMAASIQTVAGSAQSLAVHVEETSSSISEMGAAIEEMARSSDVLATSVTQASTVIEGMASSTDRSARDLDGLAKTMTGTTETIEHVTSSIEAVARSAEVMSQSAQRTSQTVEDLANAVTEVSRLAAEADEMSRRASDDAGTGDTAVGKAVRAMTTLSESMESTTKAITGLGSRSQEIGRILEVIDEIADQTNLLALNAAIEAARAGEAGRGFAVVADEVRKLAERSVEATKEIGEVIRQVRQETAGAVETAKAGASQAKEGMGLADQAGLALRRIIESVGRSSQLMAEIAAATARQSRSSAEVMRTVAEMNAATHQVASAVKEQAAGSAEIRKAMEDINRVTGQVAASIRDQASGGRQVRQAVEAMNRIAHQVTVAVQEQAEGSRQIVRSAASMNRMTQQVSHATAEQRHGAELVVQSIENIAQIARHHVVTVDEMSKAAAHLARQAENLASLIAAFKVS